MWLLGKDLKVYLVTSTTIKREMIRDTDFRIVVVIAETWLTQDRRKHKTSVSLVTVYHSKSVTWSSLTPPIPTEQALATGYYSLKHMLDSMKSSQTNGLLYSISIPVSSS